MGRFLQRVTMFPFKVVMKYFDYGKRRSSLILSVLSAGEIGGSRGHSLYDTGI